MKPDEQKIDVLADRASAEIGSCIRAVIGARHASLHEPYLGDAEIAEISRCVASGFVSSVGPKITEFESMLCEFTKAKHAVAVVNGTAALQLGLVATGVASHSEVLIPALTFVGSGNAIHYANAVPHFVDSDPVHLGVDTNKLAAYLDEIAEMRGGRCFNRQTGRLISHIMPVHIFGHVGDLTALDEIARRFGLIVVEDAAEALGSRRDGIHAGLFGACGAISFNGNKIITTGGGGAIITDDAKLAQRIRSLATTAKRTHIFEYWHDELGYNYRMPALNAALGVAQMTRLEAMLVAKARLSKAYEVEFKSAASAKFFVSPNESSSNHWLNAISLRDGFCMGQNTVLQKLNEIGYGCRPVWNLLCDMPHFRNCPSMQLDAARDLQVRLINLPSSANFGWNL